MLFADRRKKGEWMMMLLSDGVCRRLRSDECTTHEVERFAPTLQRSLAFPPSRVESSLLSRLAVLAPHIRWLCLDCFV